MTVGTANLWTSADFGRLVFVKISTTEKVSMHSGTCFAQVGAHFKLPVSYSSVLDLSVSARQKALYERAGLDVERWTEMGKRFPCPENLGDMLIIQNMLKLLWLFLRLS
jgi:hypothetical protein